MEIYSTEEQQEEAIKRFLKENGTSLIIGAIVGLGAIWGWGYYKEAQLDVIGDNSMAFSKVLESKSVASDGEKFVAEYSDTQYAQLAQLLLVKQLVDDKDYDKAMSVLKSVIASDVEDSVKSISITRLARLELATGKHEQALATLNTLDDSAFNVIKNELMGDIHLATGDSEKARVAYQAAVDASADRVSKDLRMKFDDLAPAV